MYRWTHGEQVTAFAIQSSGCHTVVRSKKIFSLKYIWNNLERKVKPDVAWWYWVIALSRYFSLFKGTLILTYRSISNLERLSDVRWVRDCGRGWRIRWRTCYNIHSHGMEKMMWLINGVWITLFDIFRDRTKLIDDVIRMKTSQKHQWSFFLPWSKVRWVVMSVKKEGGIFVPLWKCCPPSL